MSPKKPLTLSTAKRKSRISAKLAKKSEIAAKKLDKDVAKLKAKEFRESEVQNSATPDIVATQSWRLATHATTQLANTEQSTEQKANAQSTTADIDNRHSTTQTASTDPEKTLLEQQQQANAAETQTFPKFQDYGSSESTHLGQGPHFDYTQPPLVTLSQLPEIGDIKQQIEPTALTVSMARTTLTQSVRPPIISTEQHHTPLSIDEQVTHQSIKEDAPAASISGKLHAHGEAITSLQWTVAEHQGQFGRLDIDPITGEWHYQLDNNAPKTDALAEGEHQTEQFTVTVSGPNGEQVSTLIIIDVEGSNDLPQILGSHLASINAADSLQTVMGQLRSVDPDHNDVITWAVLDGQGQYGQLSINPLTGQWQYQLNNHANATLALVSGQQVTETFTVTATDLSGHPVSQQVSIQVNGADDAAIIQGKITGLVTEDTQANNGQLTVSGQLSIQDPDKDQAHFSADSLQGQFGYLTIDVNGHWIYNADNTQATIQSLRSGEHLTDTFIIHSADGTAQNITVTINGTDDKAEISGTTSASLTEDSDTYQGMLRANGNLTITDNDHGPHLFTATEQSGQFGTLTIDELGHWTYIADNSQTAIQALKTGESITDTLVVQTQDGTQQTISITIHGTDDHSVIRGTSVVRVFEDKRLSQGQLHTDGQLWVSNPDTGRAGFAAEQRQGQFGVLSINSDGHWTYIADNNNPSIQALKHGEFVTETLFVKALDGTSQKIEILIKGADDKAIIGGTDTATLVEDQSPQHGQLQAHGTLTITDPDAGQAQFSALTDVAGSAGYGHFSIDATGNWTYTVDNTLTAIQQLNTGEHLTDSLTISSADGTNHTLKVTITGSNDAPVVAQSLVTTTATEDTAFSFSIPAGTFADIDTGDTLILSTGSLPAWLHFDAATGTFSGTPTNGDVGTLQVTITATDGSGAQVSTIFVLNVDNTNDAPTLTPIATVHATEDGAQVTGQFTATDPDSGDKLTFSIAQPVDGLSVNTDGSWRFDPSHASYQHLAAGQTLTLTIPVTVTDAAGATSSQDLVIKLNGSNDGATIGGVSTGSAKEDNAQITTGQLIVADVDDGEAHFVAQTDTAGTYGHFSLSADGRWSYQLDNSKPEIQQLSEGVMLHENFTVHSADGTTHTISVDIVGTNDAPVLAAQSQSVTEDGTKLSGQMVATDVDTGDSQTFSTTAQTAGFTLNADGSYSFDPTDAAYQHLATGQTETLTIPITVTDSTGATSTANLTITLTGSNDGAVISGTDAGTVTEDTQLTTGGQLTVTDIDDQESAFTAQANTAGSYGSFTLAADGHWTYTLDNKNSAVQALGQNATLTDSLTVQSVDGTTHTITVNINGHDDGAVIAGVDSGTVTEDANLTAGQLETHGQLTISDPDAGQDHFTAQTHVAGSYGTFSLDADGQWRYSADNSQSAIQQLKAGEPLTDSLTVQSVGGTTHTVTVTITGSNDAPVLIAQSQSITEDGTKLTGQMVATDVDTGDTLTFSLANAVDGFTLNADGSYSFAPSNAAYQHLAAGQTQTLAIPVTVTDSAGASSTQNLTITLTGTNDGATLTDHGTPGQIKEDLHTAIEGHLSVRDVDSGEGLFPAQQGAGLSGYGSFVLTPQANGQAYWRYSVDNSKTEIQQLGEGQLLHDSFTVHSADGTTHTISVDIVGTNDVPVLTAQSQSVTEDGSLLTGQMVATDVDTGDTLTFSLANAVDGFTLNADGSYSFEPIDAAYQHLAQGLTETLTIPVSVTDSAGATATQQLVITVSGSNDGAVISGTDAGAVTEDTQLTTAGQLTVTDIDDQEAAFTAQTKAAGSYGSFTLAADGHWTYTLDNTNPTVQALSQTGTLTDSLTVQSVDGTTHQITVTINGHDDGAVIAGVDSGTVTEDANLTADQLETHGKLTITDPDTGQDHFTAQTNVAGSYGTFSLDADGQWHYSADNSQTAIQQLKAGETLTDSLTVQSVGGTTHTVTVTITGSNDAPVLTTQSQSVSEDGSLLTGQMVATDVDTGDSQTFSTTAQTAGFTLNADGSYSFDPTDAAYQHLAAGQTETLSIPVSVTDSAGATATQQLVITVSGSNDGAIISGTDTGAVTEDTQLTTQGQLTVTDIDDQESAFTAQANTAGSYGNFTLAADGHWTYTLDNKNSAVQALGQNATLTDSLTVQAVDGTTHTITVTINGHDDGAVIAGVDSGAVTEDSNVTTGKITTSGQLTISDPDAGQDHFTAQTHVAGSYGTFSLDQAGHWTYVSDNNQSAIQQLKAGETLTDSLTVQSVGGTTHTITVTLTGTNDAPVLTAQSQSITEDGTKLTGQMVATDVDTGDTLTFSLANAVDGFTLNADGSYSFDPSNAAYQHLAAGQTQTLTIPVSVTDSAGATATQQLVITVTGSNDGAIISGTDAGTVTEDTQLTTGGQLTVTDIDDQESAFTAQAKTAGSYGSFTLAADGHWTYTLNNSLPAVQALGQNGTLTDSLTVQSVDGTTHTITVTINGHDDGALIAGIDSGTVTEDANLTAGQLETHGQLTISDPDAGQDHFTAQTHVAGSYGSFSLDADGQWNYSADNSQTAIQQLKAGETLTDSLTVQSVGGTTHTVTVTITGSNDAPVLTAQSQSVTEDGNKLSGQMVATDVDTGDSQTFSTTAQTAGFTLNADGSYSFDPANAAYQHLAAGQTETLTIPVSVTDSTGATSTANLTITLTGSNDGAIISGTDASAVTEDTQLTTGGQLTVTDIDDQESAFTAQAKTAGSYGSFTLAADGHWTYTLNNSLPAVQALGQNATLTDSLAVQSMDGTTHTITVTINGHDDGAVIAGVDSGTVTEDCNVTTGKITTSGQLTISDPDAGQDHFTAQTNVAGSYGTFSLDQAGHWTYVSDNSQTAVQQLKAGETLTDSLTVQSVGGTTHTVTVTLTGSNDAPVLTAQSQSVTEDGNKLSGQMVATDVDTGDTLTFSLANAVDGFTLNADGSYSFDPANAAYQHLAAGQTETLTIPVSVTDSAGATATQLLVITVTGSNDGAIISGTDAGWVIEDTQLTTGGQLTVTDIDDQESAFTAQANTAGSYGNFTLAADGHWTYTLDNKNSAVQALGQNATLTDSLTVQSMDGTTHKVTVTINGHDDGAVIAGVDSGAVTEDSNVKISGLISFSSTLTVSDIDTGEARFPLQQGAGSLGLGNFLLAPTGGWGYSVDNNLPEIQQLKAGQTLVETYTFHSADGSQHTVTVTITGSNDAPVLTAQRQSVSEDGTKLNGQMIATDVDTGDSQTFSTTAQTAGFTLNADGSYSFDPTDAAYQHLAAGQTETLSIPITVTDSSGATSTANLTITLTGSNDGAVISGTDAGTVIEDTQLTTGGQLTVTDIDDQESAFTEQANTAGSYGSFTLAADGHWTYTLDNSLPAVQALGQNATLTDSLTVQSVDGTTHTITVTINGHDDGAVIAGVDSGTVTEDANLTAGQLETRGQLTISDPDAGQDHFTAQTNVAGSYGSFSLDQAGHWTYVSDNSQTAIQQLKAGETLTDSLTVQSVGGTTHTVTVTITGSNDAPVLTAQSQSITEDGTKLTGQMVATDVDTGDTLTFSLANAVDGFTLNADGSYSFAPANAAYQHLAAGQTETLTIPITVTDSTGATSTANLTITLTGSNDGAIISGTDADTVTEDTQLTTGGQLTVTDIDDQESAFTAQVKTAGSYGSFTLAADGHWTYTLDNSLPAVQALGQNATLTDSLTVQSVDGTTHTVTVNINGHDDGAVITGVDSGTVTEDSNVTTGKITTSGQLTISDPDAGQDHFTAQTHVAGSYGSFSLDADGQWNYSADNSQTAIQQLKAGETLTDSLTVQSVGGTTHTVTVTITGSNDAPVLTAQSQSVSEDGTQLSGQMVATDVDSGDSQTFSTTAQTAGFTLNADGSYSFDPSNAAYQHLPAGQTETLSIPITVTDNAGATSTANLTITLTGSNDGAIISGTDAGTVTEDTQLTTGGQLTVTDIDDQESAFTAQAKTAGSYGSFTLAADGHWTYTLDNKNSAVQALGQNATLTDSLTVQSVDGTTHKVTVTINGHDDGAVIAGVDSGAVTEDANLTAGQLETHGQLTISDPDAGQDHFTAQTNVAGSYGTFSLDADGQWHYSADNSQTAIQQLKAGATLTDSFTVTSADGTNHTVTVTLTGSNDAPVLTAQSQSVMEDGSRLSGQMVATDVDQGDTLHFSIGTRVAGFTLNADGSYNFDPSNAAYQHLAAGQTQTLAIPVTVTDSAGATSTANLTITLTGTNDGATLTDHGTPGQIKEDLHTAIEGHLSVRDVDSGEGLFPAQQGAGLSGYGSFILTPQANGQAYWRYSVDNSKTEIQQLGEGQLLHDSFTVHSADGTTHTISVDIVGTHDVPVLTAQSQSVTEDGSLLTGQMVATDVDTGDTLTFSLANAVDGFTLNADGSYSFDPTDAAYQHLAQGQTETLSIPITVTDSAGATSTANLTITLTGSNDGAVISGTDAGTVTEDTQLTTSGQLAVTDIDDQESAFTAQANTAGSYGSFTLAADGRWTYTLDNTNPTVQALSQTGTLTDSLTVQSVDGTTHTVTVTINGHDDGAVIAGVDSGTVTEDANLTAGKLETHGQLTISDPDAGQDHFTAQTNVAGSYGTFSLDADGQWHYSADNSQTAIQQLKAGETLTDSLTVQSVGGTTHTVTITLTGSNDAPVLTAQSQSVTEDGSLLTGQMVATDVDTGDTLTFSLANSVDGFTLNADGSYSFDPSNAAYQHLAASQTQDLVIPVTVTDSAGASHTQNLTITVAGVNDGAVIGGAFTGAVTEDQSVQSGQLQASGQLTITDADSGESHFIPQTDVLGSDGLGRFSLDAQGHWSYSADNSQKAIQQLGVGATLNDSFTVQGADGALHTVTVTLTGSNDAPQFHLQVAPDYHPEVESSDVLPLVINNIGSSRIAQYLDIQQILQGQAPIGAYANTCVTVSLGGLALIGPDGQAAQVFAAGQEFKLQTLVDWQQQGPGHEFRVFGPKGTVGLDISFHDAGDPNHITGPQGQASLYVNQVSIWPPFHAWQASASTGTASDSGLLTATEGGPALSGQFHASDIDVGDTLAFSLGHPVDGFTLNADGSYSFDPAHPSYQHLAAGQSETLSIPITVTDSAGASTTQTLSILLRGANDAATFGGVETGATQEDRPDALSGQLTVADADDGEAHFIAQSGTAGSYGQFSLDENGQWHYQIDNSKPEVQALRDGQSVTDSFTVRSADGTVHTVNISIAGKNDAAVITGEDHQTLTEDQNVSGGQLIAHGQLHASTPDAGGDQFTPLQDLAGKFGQLSLSAGGSWVYKADNSSPAVQALHAGQSATESFTVHSVDGTAHTISINIQGADESRHDILSSIVSTLKSNWAPFKQIGNAIDARDAGSLGNVVLSFYGGNPHVVDADGHVLASGSNKGMFGYDISLGQVVGLLKSHPGAQLVLDGQTGASSSFYLHDSGNSMQLTFAGNARYNVHDNTLGSVPIDGLPTPLSAAGAVLDVSDSLTISVTDISVDHAGQLQTSGQLNISDADAGENHFNAQKDVAGTYGSFSIDASGHWVYSVDNGQAAVQNLQAGAQLTDSFMVMSADGTSHVVSVAVYGKNDAPVLFAQSQSVSEDGAQLSGQMHASDVDAGDTQTFSIDQPVAGFALKADGSYSFDPSNAAYQHLAEGQTETLTIPITVTDHMGASSVRDLTITLTGKNDAAVITGVDQRTVTEDQDVDGFGNLHVTGQLQVDDPDGNAGPLQFQQQNAVQASYGHFTLNADGYWLYEADNKNPAIQQLKTGESLTDTLTAHSADGTSHTITVTIQGQDDAAAFVPQAQAAQVSSSDVYTIIGVQLMSSEHREFQFMAEVLLGNTDPRSYVSAEMSFTNTSVALRAPDGSLASVYHAAGGMTTVPLMDLRNWHNKGQGYDVVLVDATGMPVNVFPHDLGDPDKMSGFNQYVTGFSGPFNAAVVLYPDTQAASSGGAVQGSGGAVQGSGGAVQGSAVVPAMAPVLYDAAHVLEDNGQQISGFIEVQDADQGQSSMQPMTDHHAAHGTFSIDVNGDWVYQLDSSRPDVQALKDGETLIDTITVHSADGTPHKVNITIHGQADGAVISGADTGRVIEDQQVTAAGLIETQGQLLLSDPDAGEEVFVAQANAAGKYGVFSFDEDGHWRYSADSSQAVIQQLKAGAALSDIFTVHSADGTAHTVSVMITGSNDAPVLTAQSQAYDQGGAQYRGQMSATDADAGDALHFSTTTTVAGFTLHADGSYQFDPSDAAYQHLASGQSQNVVIPITVTDSAGATSTQNLTFTVTSAAHGAVISGVDSGSMIEDGSSAVASGQLSIVDPDAGEAHFLAQANVSGQHGHFSLLENGAWTYTLDNKDAAVQALKAGESLTEHLTVSSVDGTTHVLTVTVQGSNDAPVLQAQSQSVTEDGSLLHGKMVAQDGDHGDALRFSTPNAVGGFTLNADGSYSFDPCHHDYQSLGAGQTRDIAIPITVTDSAGATATQMLNVHITGRDDRTSIYGVDSGSVQAGVHPETSGDLHASDDDAGQSGFRAGTVNGSFGRLSIDAQGHWTYWVDGSDPFVMHLLPNSHITEQLTVHSVDGTAHDIEIEVSGPPGGGQLNAPVDNVNVQYVALPQVWDAYQAQTGVNKGGHEVFAGILAAVRAGGYQYQGLADELDKGNLAVVSNMDVSISGVHVQVVDAFGHLVQNFSPTTENAATLHMSDVLNWHAQGYSILASSDSGLDSVRLWLHNTGDMHNIQVQLPSGTGFNAWADQWTFGELQFHAQTSSQSSDEANFETIDSVNLDVAEPATLATSAHDLDLASSGHLNVSSVNYDASLLVGSVDEQTAQTNPAQDKSVDTTLFEGGNFSAQATTSPIDHYLQMVGLMPNSIEQQPTAPIELATLNTPSSTFQDMDTDMLDMVTINHFENPLIEEHKTPHLDQYGFQEEHAQLEVNPNDDDLLHSALNDMHNQM
ncbi:VCBS domain-containing protein [Shewanella xiamenensis]|uniref:VCBS domain-containing protein n=4 Tax=Shewanella xiamenensis TaxID=332186 RepID=UPI00242CCC99|nr:VCBS domain-containing protein [Shewanella xiamenensis]